MPSIVVKLCLALLGAECEGIGGMAERESLLRVTSRLLQLETEGGLNNSVSECFQPRRLFYCVQVQLAARKTATDEGKDTAVDTTARETVKKHEQLLHAVAMFKECRRDDLSSMRLLESVQYFERSHCIAV